MGVDAKGVCKTASKDVFSVCSKVESSLNKMILKNKATTGVLPDLNNTLVRTEMIPSVEMVVFRFTVKGESRKLHLHFSCDSDEPKVKGKKLIWSVGMWGSSELIIRTVGEALQDLGKIYIDLNDCDDIGLLPVPKVSKDSAEVHYSHCNQGDYEGSFKYGDDSSCPAFHNPQQIKS